MADTCLAALFTSLRCPPAPPAPTLPTGVLILLLGAPRRCSMRMLSPPRSERQECMGMLRGAGTPAPAAGVTLDGGCPLRCDPVAGEKTGWELGCGTPWCVQHRGSACARRSSRQVWGVHRGVHSWGCTPYSWVCMSGCAPNRAGCAWLGVHHIQLGVHPREPGVHVCVCTAGCAWLGAHRDCDRV